MTINNQSWFVGKDIAEALGYTNSRKALIDHVNEEDKEVTKCETYGGAQNMVIINESGLYSLLLSSKLPKAKEFKHWLTHEVLPSINHTGAYLTDKSFHELLNNPEEFFKVMDVYKEQYYQR